MQLIPDLEDHRRFGEAAAELAPEERSRVRDKVVEACKPIAQSWPMKTFAYRNPLRGWEHLPFDEAVREAKHLLGGNGYIPNEDYRQLYREGRITEDAVKQALQAVASSVVAQTVTLGDRQVAASDVLHLHLLYGFDPLDRLGIPEQWRLRLFLRTGELNESLLRGTCRRSPLCSSGVTES